MKDEFVEYIRKLGMADPLTERVIKLERAFRVVSPEEPQAIFVSEYQLEDGTRNYESLFLISKNYLAEFKNFVNSTDFEIDRIGGSITNLLFNSEEFDFDSPPNSKSRLSVRYYTAHTLTANLRASADNCAHLTTIARQFFVTNLVR